MVIQWRMTANKGCWLAADDHTHIFNKELTNTYLSLSKCTKNTENLSSALTSGGVAWSVVQYSL